MHVIIIIYVATCVCVSQVVASHSLQPLDWDQGSNFCFVKFHLAHLIALRKGP